MIGDVPAQRDPVSELFDAGARKLLARAYARPGIWVGTRLAPPRDRHRTWARASGIDLDEVDRWGQRRWVRAFIRACYYQHQWYWDGTTGQRAGWRPTRRMTPFRGYALVYEPGRTSKLGVAFRVRILEGGRSSEQAVRRHPSRSYAENPDLRSSVGDRDYT